MRFKQWRIEQYRKNTNDIIQTIKNGKSPSFVQRSILSLSLFEAGCGLIDLPMRQLSAYPTRTLPLSVTQTETVVLH